MTIDQLIQNLNETVRCKLAPSDIHGVGVFAIRDIEKGERLYCQEGQQVPIYVPYKRFREIRPEVREIILSRYPLVRFTNTHFLSPNDDARLISFMNDGKNDSNYDPHTDTALRDIKEGEEITENYGILHKK